MRHFAMSLCAALFVLGAGCGPAGKGGSHPATVGDGGPNAGGDPNVDADGDGYTPAQGDCNDHDPNVHPGATEICNGIDDNCDGRVDETCDADMDGYTPADGDCNDTEPLVNPGAFEVVGNMVDDNCNGLVDEVTPPCDTMPGNDPKSYAGAMELCAPWVVSAQWVGSPDPTQHAIDPDYGKSYKPKAGRSFAVLSTGIAADEDDPGYVDPQPGTGFSNPDVKNPLPMNQKNNVCGASTSDELFVHDYVELKLTLKVPTNAKSFSFNFNFLSAEYPEFVGSEYNDKFLALLDSQSFKGNLSFDSKKNPITVNVGFFQACDSASICDGTKTNSCTPGKVNELTGTGYELDDGLGERIGGGTGWLTTTAPVTPGETATLRFILFDEGDNVLDSAVILDNFQWELQAAGGPTTIQ